MELQYITLLANLTNLVNRLLGGLLSRKRRKAPGGPAKLDADDPTEDPSSLPEASGLVEATVSGQSLDLTGHAESSEPEALLTMWRTRPLGACVYLFLDVRYESVRSHEGVEKVAILTAVGITEEGRRRVLGLSLPPEDPEEHWHPFLESLVARGLHGVRLVISDAHPGLQEAVDSMFSGVSWQYCQYQLLRSAQEQAPTEATKRAVAGDLRVVFAALDRQEADRRLTATLDRYRVSAPSLVVWMQCRVPYAMTAFDFPENHRRLIRTASAMERFHQEMRRRTRASRLFPDKASCVRLVAAVLLDVNQEWGKGEPYINFA